MDFFNVKHPQLEYQPGELREGLKRYNFNKNMNSYEFPTLSNSPIPNIPQYMSRSEINSSRQSPEIMKLKQQLLIKQQEIEKLKTLAEGLVPSNKISPPNTNIDLSPPKISNKITSS